MDITVTVDAAQVSALFGSVAAGLDAEIARASRKVGTRALTTIRAKASGRPGPRARTGDYRRSWNLKLLPDGFSIGTNRPQAARLEYGFVGADSLGRVYNQPPFPHMQPTLDLVGPEWQLAVLGILP